MASMVRQLLRNRNHPCGCPGLLDYLKRRPCNFIQTQTLISKAEGPSQAIIRTPFALEMKIDCLEGMHSPGVIYLTRRSHAIRKVIAPVLVDLSGQIPHVPIYKMVLPKEHIGGTLGPLHVTTLPMFFFYKLGEKVAEVVGPDVVSLKDTFIKLYSDLPEPDQFDEFQKFMKYARKRLRREE